MRSCDFYDDRRWCEACSTYVPYLLSPSASWCTRCGRKVGLFSEPDRSRFERELKSERTSVFELSSRDDVSAGDRPA